MWTVFLNGMAVGFALRLCHRLHQDRLNHRPVHADPYAFWLPPVITLTETSAVIAELCEPNPDRLAISLDLLAAAGMLLICIRLWRQRRHMPHTPMPTRIQQKGPLPSSITAPPRYRP